jgi:hypothetical protein
MKEELLLGDLDAKSNKVNAFLNHQSGVVYTSLVNIHFSQIHENVNRNRFFCNPEWKE